MDESRSESAEDDGSFNRGVCDREGGRAPVAAQMSRMFEANRYSAERLIYQMRDR
jgi:hypothetical protein